MDTPEPVRAQGSSTSSRRIRVRYARACVRCGKELIKGVEALYDAPTRTIQCIECEEAPANTEIYLEDPGVAGSSARREYEARRAARDERVKRRLGNFLGGVVLAVTDEPQSTRAWARGAEGEEKLADALADVPDLKVLSDRRVPNTRGNIDHILIAPAGVFVLDAKHYAGLIRIRDVGGLFKIDSRIYVGRRDCSHLAENMGWQVEAVVRALVAAGFDPPPPVTPVLCFIDGQWPLLSPPEEFHGVRIEGKKSIKKLIAGAEVIDSSAIERMHRALATALPAK